MQVYISPSMECKRSNYFSEVFPCVRLRKEVGALAAAFKGLPAAQSDDRVFLACPHLLKRKAINKNVEKNIVTHPISI